jgi:DNA-binding winged helix-turn-helix (wHTH) protein/tetratricopeptide (TPR) repeat protein/TolB-like protein
MGETDKLNTPRDLYEFGPFRLESRERRLLKEGTPIALPPKVFDTLRVLVENAGHVVTKDELMASLWPGTSVEEGNLTKNIWLIRKALEEKEGDDRYIETVPKAGYRFVAPMRPTLAGFPSFPTPPPEPPFEPRETAPLPAPVSSDATPAPVTGTAPTPFRLRWLLGAALGSILALGILWFARRIGPRSPASATPKSAAAVHTRRSVAVLGFQNLSGRSEAGWLSTAVSEMVSAELAGGEKLRLVPAENIARYGGVRHPAVAGTLSRETLANLRASLDADLVLSGSYVAMSSSGGNAIRFDMTLQDTVTGESVATVTETGNESDLFNLVSSAGGKLRADLGLLPASSSEGAGTAAVLPKDREAARLYADGLAKLRAFDALGARPLLEASIRVEPDFGPAHEALSQSWSALGYDENARTEAKESFRLASGSPPAIRTPAEARLAETEKDWARAESLEVSLLGSHPDDLEAALRLAEVQIAGGRARQALATLFALAALPAPSRDDPRIDLARANAFGALSKWRDQLQEAGQAAEKARRNGSTLLLAQARLSEAGALRDLGDTARGRRGYEDAAALFRSAGDSNGEAEALIGIANATSSEGKYDEARTLWRRAQATCARTGNRKGEAHALSDLAILDWLRGDVDSALAEGRQVLALNRSINDQRGIVWGLNATGNVLADQGQFEPALALQKEGIEISRKIGDDEYLSYGLSSLGDTFLAQGRLAEARGKYEDSLALSKKLGDPDGEATRENDLGNVFAAEGELSQAQTHYDTALAGRRRLGLKDEAAESQMLIAQLRNAEGHYREAAQLAGQAARVFADLRQTGNGAISLATEARAELGLGKFAEARALCGKARALLKNNRQNGANLPVLMEAVRVETAANPDAAEGVFSDFETRARKSGWLLYILESRRARAEIEIRTGRMQEGLQEARSVVQEARLKGFGLIAAEAQSLLLGDSR